MLKCKIENNNCKCKPMKVFRLPGIRDYYDKDEVITRHIQYAVKYGYNCYILPNNNYKGCYKLYFYHLNESLKMGNNTKIKEEEFYKLIKKEIKYQLNELL